MSRRIGAPCGHWMRYAQEFCARGSGHATGQHRTRWAMNNEIRRPVVVIPATFIFGPAPCLDCQMPLYFSHSENSLREGTAPLWRDGEGKRHHCRPMSDWKRRQRARLERLAA